MISEEALRTKIARYRQRYRVPAIGAAIVTRDDCLIEVLGDRARDQQVPVNADDAWHLGSCGKSITAAVFARLVERGDAVWGIPIEALFPDLLEHIDQGWLGRTIDEFLVCRSGMKPNFSMARTRDAWRSGKPAPEQRREVVAEAIAERPGARGRFVYSNLGYILVGAAIDWITGLPFEQILEREVLRPLGMESTGIGAPPTLCGHMPRWQLGPLRFGPLMPLDPKAPESDNPAVMTSAGRLHMPLADWARFQRVFLDGGSDFLKRETIEHLLALPKGGQMAMGWGQALGLGQVAYGMQGSNMYWSATAMLHERRDRIALLVCSDGRARTLQSSLRLTAEILTSD